MYYEFLAPGFEEIEAIATLDIMRRAGRTVGIGSRTVTGSHGIPVTADISEPEVDFDAAEGMILPGGMPGTLGLERSKTVGKMLSAANEKGLL
ncbi:MAG: DJ-1/PfpI family protein, partial [Acutalibacteraceae bacterium]